jgi:hypothetical protein
MRKALVVGIDYYSSGSNLFGCVHDARSVETVLKRHGNGSLNFDVHFLGADQAREAVSRADLKDAITELFTGESEVALLYFAGHGHIEATGGYILGSDSTRGDDGVALMEVLSLANASQAKNKVIVLDSCHSGIAGTLPTGGEGAVLSEGITILTASTAEQYATESAAGGVFTTLFVNALNGAACNLVGDISPGSVYAHIDQSLGAWDQRPVFKTNVKSFVSLRKVQPPIGLAELRLITHLFPKPGYLYPLDPSFEPEMKGRDPGMPPPDSENTQNFAVLQKYNRVNLVVPVGAEHMWHAAMQSKSCKLTVLGEHYRRLVARGRI